MKKNNNIDSIFKEKFQDFAPIPDAKVWEAVTQKMKKKKKRIVVFWVAGIAATILLLLTLAIPQFFSAKNNQRATTVVAKNNKQNNIITHKAIADNKEANQNKNLNKKSEKIDGNTSKKLIAETKSKKAEKVLVVKELQQSRINRIATLPKQKGIYIALHSNQQPYTKLVYNNSSALERNLVAYNILKQGIVGSGVSQKKWSIIGQVATAYTNEKSASTQGRVNVGGGMKVNLKMGKKLALQTGVAFSRYRQLYKNKNSNLMANTYEFATENLLAEPIGNEMPITTSAGRVVSNQKPRNSILAEVKFDGANIFHNPQKNIEQLFDYVEVPLLLRYNILDRKIGVFVLGGVGVNWLIANGVYTTNNHKKIGEFANLNRTAFLSQVGLGIEYKISSKLKIGIEPTFKYYLNSLNSDKLYNYKPYSIGVQTGISIDL